MGLHRQRNNALFRPVTRSIFSHPRVSVFHGFLSLLSPPAFPFVFPREIEATLTTLTESHANWKQLLEKGSADEIEAASAQLKRDIKSFQADVEMLTESIGSTSLFRVPSIRYSPLLFTDVTEAQQTRFDVSREELEDRRRYVRTVQAKVKQMQDSLRSPAAREKLQKKQKDVYFFPNRCSPPTPPVSLLFIAVNGARSARAANEARR
jgi:hypothetical protein